MLTQLIGYAQGPANGIWIAPASCEICSEAKQSSEKGEMKMAAREQKLYIMELGSRWTKAIFLCYVSLFTTIVNGQHLRAIKSDEGVEILEGQKKILFYQVRARSVDGKYERAGFLHPLYSFSEKILTENMPKDHPYHRGIFWAWHQIILKKKQVADGWLSDNISWEPVKVELYIKRKRVAVFSEILWKSVLESTSTAIIREDTRITVYRSSAHLRVIDFDIKLLPLKEDLSIGGSDDEKGYGGFCLRLKLPEDILFVSGDTAVTPRETAIHAGPWMDFIGSFDGKDSLKTGIAVFSHVSNPGRSGEWILRKKESMQNVVYPGRMPVELPKNGLRLRYRLVVHDNVVTSSELGNLFEQYIHKE